MRFPESIAMMRAGGAINAGFLHFMDFKSGVKRYWMGSGPLRTIDGNDWEGVGDVVSIEGGGQQAGFVANNLTLTMAASSDVITDDLVKIALKSEVQVYGRRYIMSIQFFDADWQPIDSPRAFYSGVMDRMSFRHSADLRQITLNIESPFVRRRAARLETFSYTDQKSKYTDDEFFEFMSGLKEKSVPWPKF